ncbi:MAG: putative dithiol-disulfide oxidoreductase (DUF899 family) [Halioglobus sp.]|jgi:predicted dithiol-disulfide oxidoreductase (DUF899 family)
MVGKAPPPRINTGAKERDWRKIDLISGYECSYQVDYGCQDESDDNQHPKINVFKKMAGEVFDFRGTETPENDLDIAWSYWHLMDLTPKGRSDREN